MNLKKSFTKLRLIITNIITKFLFPCIFKVKKYNFKIADTQSELEGAYKLSLKVYGEELNYVDTNKYKDGKYTDKYDEFSVIFVCLKNSQVIGTLRLIMDSKLGFYLERDFPIIQPNIPREEIAELSRFVISKWYRGGFHLVSLGLLQCAILYSKHKNIKYWYILTGTKIKSSFEKYGINIKLLEFSKLTNEQVEERKLMWNYYQTVRPLPYIVTLK